MSLTNFPNGITSFGVPLFGLGGIIPSPGSVFFVDGTSGSDGNSGASPDRAFKTLSYAHTKMTANQNDTVVIVRGNSSAATGALREAANLAWTKSLCHILGSTANRVAHRQSLRETSGGTTVTKLMDNSADGCVFANFHVYEGNSTAADQYAWDESGNRNAWYNVHIGGMGHQTPADRAGSRDILITGGGEHYFKDCVFGLDTVDRGAANACIELASGTVRNLFENCLFNVRADATSPLFVKVGAVGIDRWVAFKGCVAINAGTFTGGSTLAQALSVNAAPGGVVYWGSAAVGVTALETTASACVYTVPVPAAGTGGEGTANTG